MEISYDAKSCLLGLWTPPMNRSMNSMVTPSINNQLDKQKNFVIYFNDLRFLF